ncbi:pseudouridine synthase [Bacillus cereus]|nr:pseudouridine synthase [Bacillus cereus]
MQKLSNRLAPYLLFVVTILNIWPDNKTSFEYSNKKGDVEQWLDIVYMEATIV